MRRTAPALALRECAMRAMRVRAGGDVVLGDQCLGQCEIQVNADYCRHDAECGSGELCSATDVELDVSGFSQDLLGAALV